jgi:hypothetical protein
VARKIAPPTGVLLNVLVKFEDTEEFRSLADRTKADYKAIIDKKIMPQFGDFPLAALTDKRARGEFKDWRDRLALKSRRQADYAWVVLARILAVALDRGWIGANPCEKGGRLYHGTRAETGFGRRTRSKSFSWAASWMESAYARHCTWSKPLCLVCGQVSAKVTSSACEASLMTARISGSSRTRASG